MGPVGFEPTTKRLRALFLLGHIIIVVPKGTATTAAAVPIHLHTAVAVVTYWLANFTPALKCLPTTLWAFMWTNFCFAFDIWQTKYDNRHGELLLDGCVETTISLGACRFCQNPALMLHTLVTVKDNLCGRAGVLCMRERR